MDRDFKFYAQRQIHTDSIEIAAIRKLDDGSREFLSDVTVEKLSLNGYVHSFLSIDATQAQRLIDELWSCGLRPSEGSGSAGALAATERHLADMQRLVFDRKGAA